MSILVLCAPKDPTEQEADGEESPDSATDAMSTYWPMPMAPPPRSPGQLPEGIYFLLVNALIRCANRLTDSSNLQPRRNHRYLHSLTSLPQRPTYRPGRIHWPLLITTPFGSLWPPLSQRGTMIVLKDCVPRTEIQWVNIEGGWGFRGRREPKCCRPLMTLRKPVSAEG